LGTIETRSGLTISSSCAVEKRSAISLALGSSFQSSSSKPIEKVRTGSGEVSAIAATTVAESIPPERKAPSGTSEIILSLTACRISRRISSWSSGPSGVGSGS
jgi:hypothetical protein